MREIFADAGVDVLPENDPSNLLGRHELRGSYLFAICDEDDPVKEMRQLFERLLYNDDVEIEIWMVSDTAYELTLSDNLGHVTYLCDDN